jgi:ABC-2 type transport system permease protein
VTELIASTGYALRACLPRRRQIGVVVLGVVALGFGLLAGLLSSPLGPAADFAGVGAESLFGLVLPLVGLVAGDAVLGAEVRRGTFHFTWVSPAPTWTIVAGRWLGGAAVAVAVVVPSFAGAALLSGAPVQSAVAAATGGGVGAAAYVALFVAIATLVRRAPTVSLAVVVLGEILLGRVVTSLAQISPMWEGRAIFLDWAPLAEGYVRKGIPAGSGAIVRLALVSAVCLVVATLRMRSMKVQTSASD